MLTESKLQFRKFASTSTVSTGYSAISHATLESRLNQKTLFMIQLHNILLYFEELTGRPASLAQGNVPKTNLN